MENPGTLQFICRHMFMCETLTQCVYRTREACHCCIEKSCCIHLFGREHTSCAEEKMKQLTNIDTSSPPLSMVKVASWFAAILQPHQVMEAKMFHFAGKAEGTDRKSTYRTTLYISTCTTLPYQKYYFKK